MKRYHSLLGTGSGIGCHITPDMLDAADTTEAMRENHSGCWVTYHEARGIEDRLNAITQQLAVNTAEFDASTAAAYDRGLTKGRKEGQVKVDAMQRPSPATWTPIASRQMWRPHSIAATRPAGS